MPQRLGIQYVMNDFTDDVYGNPSTAQWTNMPDLLELVDFKHILDADRLKDSFPDDQIGKRGQFTP